MATDQTTAEIAGKFRKVSEIARLIHESHDLRDILHRLTEGVCMHSSWTISSIQALDLARRATTPIVRYDPHRPDAAKGLREWDASDSPLTRIVETGQAQVLPDASAQDKYKGFREDALRRGYRTVVMIPLKFPDEQGRAIVFTVISNDVVEVDAAEMGFLQCLVDLADIAVRRMRALRQESDEAQNLRDIIANLTAALATSLDADRANDLFSVLSRLFPTGWVAIDRTTGRVIHDPAAVTPALAAALPGLADTLIRLTMRPNLSARGQDVRISLDGTGNQTAHMKLLLIDGTTVGALFLLEAKDLTPHEEIAAQAGQFALSTLIMRSYLAFRIRGHSAQRLMKRLFAGEIANPDELLEEAGILEFELHGPMRLLAISCADRQTFEQSAHSFIHRKVQTHLGQAVSCIIRNRLFLLVHDTDKISDPAQREAMLQSIQPVLPGPAAIVRSEPIVSLEQIAPAYEICSRNLQVAESMRAQGWISGGKIGSFPALMSSVSESLVHEFLATTVEPISDGGSSRGKVAIKTLSTFLATGRRLQEAADLLGIHVSTLRYRLERLSDRHQLDLNDSEKCFELELALRLYNLRNSYRR